MHADLPPLARSTFIQAPEQQWEGVWKTYIENAHPSDVWTPEDWSKPLAVRDVRTVRTFVGQQAVGEGRFIALPRADILSREVANALLKLLEEPPAGVHFLLFGETDRMLATIRSRVRLLTLGEGQLSENRLLHTYQTASALKSPGKVRRLLYYAPLLHSTVQTDHVLDALS